MGSFFVTRLKKNANLKPVENLRVKDAPEFIEADESVLFGKKYLNARRPNHYQNRAVRRVQIRREDHQTRSVEEIADLYKQRW